MLRGLFARGRRFPTPYAPRCPARPPFPALSPRFPRAAARPPSTQVRVPRILSRAIRDQAFRAPYPIRRARRLPTRRQGLPKCRRGFARRVDPTSIDPGSTERTFALGCIRAMRGPNSGMRRGARADRVRARPAPMRESGAKMAMEPRSGTEFAMRMSVCQKNPSSRESVERTHPDFDPIPCQNAVSRPFRTLLSVEPGSTRAALASYRASLLRPDASEAPPPTQRARPCSTGSRKHRRTLLGEPIRPPSILAQHRPTKTVARNRG